MANKMIPLETEVVVKLLLAEHATQYHTQVTMEEEALGLVAEALGKEAGLTVQAVELLEFDPHMVDTVGDLGMVFDVGRPDKVRLFPDGSWYYPAGERYTEPDDREAEGRTLWDFSRWLLAEQIDNLKGMATFYGKMLVAEGPAEVHEVVTEAIAGIRKMSAALERNVETLQATGMGRSLANQS